MGLLANCDASWNASPRWARWWVRTRARVTDSFYVLWNLILILLLQHLPGYLLLLLIQGVMLPVFPPRSRLVRLRQYRLVVRLRGAPEVLGRCRLLVSLSSVTLVLRRGALLVVPPGYAFGG